MHAPDVLAQGRELADQIQNCTIHVRNIGTAACDTDAGLNDAFGQFGDVVQTSIRKRIKKKGTKKNSQIVSQKKSLESLYLKKTLLKKFLRR